MATGSGSLVACGSRWSSWLGCVTNALKSARLYSSSTPRNGTTVLLTLESACILLPCPLTLVHDAAIVSLVADDQVQARMQNATGAVVLDDAEDALLVESEKERERRFAETACDRMVDMAVAQLVANDCAPACDEQNDCGPNSTSLADPELTENSQHSIESSVAPLMITHKRR